MIDKNNQDCRKISAKANTSEMTLEPQKYTNINGPNLTSSAASDLTRVWRIFTYKTFNTGIQTFNTLAAMLFSSINWEEGEEEELVHIRLTGWKQHAYGKSPSKITKENTYQTQLQPKFGI